MNPTPTLMNHTSLQLITTRKTSLLPATKLQAHIPAINYDSENKFDFRHEIICGSKRNILPTSANRKCQLQQASLRKQIWNSARLRQDITHTTTVVRHHSYDSHYYGK